MHIYGTPFLREKLCSCCRWVYSKTEQFVPFTKRRHCILMPSVAESMLGAHLYETFLIEQHDKVIDTAIGSPSKIDYHTCCASFVQDELVYPCMP